MVSHGAGRRQRGVVIAARAAVRNNAIGDWTDRAPVEFH
jgi:hypothetical protein